MATERSPLRGPPASPDADDAPTNSDSHRRYISAVVAASALALAVAAVIISSWFLGWSIANSKPAVAELAKPRLVRTADGATAEIFCGDTEQESGYIQLANKKDSKYFYWLFESRSDPSNDPLVVWLSGGPGASSMIGMLAENGPCTVNVDLSTTLNPFSWTDRANVLWLDQPTNVGFSFSAEPSDADSTEADVGANMVSFLTGFFAKHPELQTRPLFITGESYGGHYVPAAAHFVQEHNHQHKTNSSAQFNLQGIAIGNGIINPVIQVPHFIDMADNAYGIEFLNASELAHAKHATIECTERMEACQTNTSLCEDALTFCADNIENKFYNLGRNPYDIRTTCDVNDQITCFHPDDAVDRYLDAPNLRAALGVDSRVGKWQICNFDVNADFTKTWDVAKSMSGYVADLLGDDVRVLIYAGDADLECNWAGNLAWMKALDWRGAHEFNKSPVRAFVTDNGVHAGDVVGRGQFTFMRVFNAGHAVPQHQPAVSLDMLNRFLQDHPLAQE